MSFTKHRPWWFRSLPIVFCLAAFSSSADAHLAVKGLGEVGNGALHPLVTPAHVLVILATGLWLGQRVPFTLRMPMLVLAISSASALALTATGWIPGVSQPVLVGIALGIAVLVAGSWQLPSALRAALCAVAALGIGLDSAPEAGTPFAVAKTLLGTWFTLNLAIPYIAICASNGADKPWARTAIRILGSWIVAIALMVLAFALRK